MLYAIAAVILLVLSASVWRTLDHLEAETGWVTHTYAVREQTESVLARLRGLQADGIAYATTGDAARHNEFEDLSPLLDEQLTTLADLVRDNPAQTRRVADFAKSVREQYGEAAELVRARDSGVVARQIQDIGLAQTQGYARAIVSEETRLAAARSVDTAGSAYITRIISIAALLISLTALGLAYVLVYASHREEQTARARLSTANAQLNQSLDEARRLSQTMSKLAAFGELLHGCRTLDEIREGVGKGLADLLPNLGGRLALINPSQNLAVIGAHWGRHALLAESVFVPDDCWALRRGQAYPLVSTVSGFGCKHVQWPNPEHPAAGYLCVPLAAHNEMIGVLTFDGENAPTAEERRNALAAGERLALALANLRLQESLRTQAIRDPLTGLFNRRYLEVSLERELQRARRRSLPLAVLMLDVDHFKRFNDDHGHEAGDALLAQLGEVLKRATRAEDIACRYGGEEFTVILQETDAAVAQRRAESIRKATAEMSLLHRQQQLPPVTVSIGIAVFPGDGNTPEDLLRRADSALYRAKKSGRDRVELAQSDPAGLD